MGTLSEFRKLGLTCIGNFGEEAEGIYRRVESVLEREIENFEDDGIRLGLPISWMYRESFRAVKVQQFF
jgi:hypothetical protein